MVRLAKSERVVHAKYWITGLITARLNVQYRRALYSPAWPYFLGRQIKANLIMLI